MWWLTIGGLAGMIVSTIGLVPWLPEPIAVQWSFEGQVTNRMSKLMWLAIQCGAWTLVSSSLVALRAPLDWRRVLVVIICGVLIAAHITVLENNLGVTSATQAERLDIASAVLLAAAGSAAVWALQRALARR